MYILDTNTCVFSNRDYRNQAENELKVTKEMLKHSTKI